MWLSKIDFNATSVDVVSLKLFKKNRNLCREDPGFVLKALYRISFFHLALLSLSEKDMSDPFLSLEESLSIMERAFVSMASY